MKVTGSTQIFGLLGHPVRHSLSPEMHNHLFQQFDIDAVYLAFDVSPSRADRLADAIRTLGIRGVNLTVPFKSAILADLDELTQAGREAKAVNVVIQHDHTLVGYNTDGEGFVQSLEESYPGSTPNQRVTILGAGGAACAIAASLADLGAPEVRFLNRSSTRASEACSHLSTYFPATRFQHYSLTNEAFDNISSDSGLVINCTAAGANAIIENFSLSKLPEHAIWCDINYWMDHPPAIAACQKRDLRTLNGLGMLIHQGLLSFELFTGHPVEPETMYALLGRHKSS